MLMCPLVMNLTSFIAPLLVNSPQVGDLLAGLPVTSVQAQTNATQQMEANQLSDLGLEQCRMGQCLVAIETWKKALVLYQKTNNRPGEAATLGNLGTAYSNLSQYEQAIVFYNQALPIFQALKDQDGEITTRANIAATLLRLGNNEAKQSKFQQAITFYSQALPLFQALNDRKSEALVLNLLGATHVDLFQYQQAITFYEQALPLVQTLNDPLSEASVLNGLGLAATGLTRYSQAVSLSRQALPIFQKHQLREGVGSALKNLGDALTGLSQYSEALTAYNQALPIFQDLKNRQQEARILYEIGFLHRKLSQYGLAISYFRKALPLFQVLKDRHSEVLALDGLGTAFNGLSEYAQAIALHNQALLVLQEVKNPKVEADVLNNLGITYSMLSQFEEAISFHERALQRYQDAQSRFGAAAALTNIGNAYIGQSQYKQAATFFSKALPIFQELKDRYGEASALGNLGTAYHLLLQHERAISFQQQSLPIFKELKDRNGEAKALGSLGRIYASLSQYERATSFFSQALRIFQEVKDTNGEATALSDLGFTLFAAGNVNQAESSLRQSIGLQEKVRQPLKDDQKISIFERQLTPYITLQQVLIAQKKTEAALEIAERGRARAFVELLARRLNPTPTEIPIAPPDLQQIWQIAKQQNATLVQYSVMWDQALFIWVIQPNGTITFRQVAIKPTHPSTASQRPAFLPNSAQSELTQLIAKTRRSLRITGENPQQSGNLAFQPDPSQARKQLRRLHQLLIEPIADQLPTNPNDPVIFIPHSTLFFVPFPALQDASGTYLIEKHTLLTAPSIQVLGLTRQQKTKAAKTGNSLVVGNPAMPKDLEPLPGAELEAKNIAQLLNTQPLLGAQATKATVMQKMPQARIIHLATHGLFNSNRGLGSAVALTPSGNDDGFLTAEEILNLRLAADLVVLSACDTGKGQLTADGVIGLSRSFIAAGTPSVLVSLWAVKDDSTAFLMTEFYRILQRQPNKAVALRQAMLTTMKLRPNPIDWAAFTLIGEAN